jgi:branched-chain amino acid transport system ATP-binding protein
VTAAPNTSNGSDPDTRSRHRGSPLLDVSGLRAGYDGGEVLCGVDLSVGPGEVVALLGANGAGKTTTLLAVSGLVPAMSGGIEVLGRSIRPTRRARTTRVVELARAGLAHVPEDRALFFDLTVSENLRLGRRSSRSGGTHDDVERTLELFPALGRILDRRAGLLSGGEQQMLALARALVSRPRLLLVDELSLGLAPIIVEELLPVLRTVAESSGAGVLLVEQHVQLALAVSDHAYLLRRGRVVVEGPAAELATRTDLVTAGYLGEA